MMTKAPPIRQPRLQVFLDQGPAHTSMLVGECVWVASSRSAAFEWSETALASGLELSPVMMPRGLGIAYARHAPFSGIHPLFADSIPDGFGLRLMNRGLSDNGYRLDEINPLHRLAWIGERGVGALSYKPVIDANVEPLLTTIFDAAALAARAEAENFKDIPRQALRAGGSALGARPKFWAAIGPDKARVILGDQPRVPVGFVPSLLKFAPSRGDQNEPFLEAACLDLANKHGVRAAHCQLLNHPSGAALAVERFDRLPTGARIHTQSVAALLGLDFREPNLDYASLARLAQMIGGDADVERLYRQLCFNVALSMRDDHARNFAFCMDAAGQWSLSPAFDLCPSIGLGLTHEHTTTLNGKGTNISRGDLAAFAASLALSPQLAQDGIDAARAAASEFAALAVSLGATRTRSREWAKAFKAIDAYLQPVMVPVSTARAVAAKPKRGKPSA
jgi:serine/threonine-protein kinase HipA